MFFFAGNIVFNSANGGVPIYLDLVPFRVTGDAMKQCIFGDEYYKKSDAQHQVCSLKYYKKSDARHQVCSLKYKKTAKFDI